MSNWNRRDVCVAGAFAALGSVMAQAQTQSGESQSGAASSGDTIDTSRSQVFHFDQMQVQHHANGGWGRSVMHGTLPTGEFVEVHETMLPPGQVPHPEHKHRNSEFVMIREGKVEYWGADRKHVTAGPGDVIFSASNQLHGMKNTGDVNASYFVVAISHK